MEQQFYALRKKSRQIEPALRIGKQGVTESVCAHIGMLLKKHKLVKIKLLKNASLTSDEAIAAIVKSTDAIVVDRIGLTFSLYKQ